MDTTTDKLPRYFVATYGGMGLEVTFYSDPQEYEEAVQEAKREWQRDGFDSYINGPVA